MKSIKILILISMVICFYQFGNCQNRLPEVTMPSPNAASLGVYGEIPVSFFTGIPNIEIPVYTLSEGNITLPISLNYYASGVKPDQHPGWVGTNWSLNAGGTITRIVHDLPDEYNCPNTSLKRKYDSSTDILGTDPLFYITSVYGANAGYYFNHSINSGDQWCSEDNIKSIVSNQGDGRDTEPDEFCFNFLGYSGKFYLTDSGKWAVQCDQNITVIFEDNNFVELPENLKTSDSKHVISYCLKKHDNMKSFGGFTLITDNGTKYVFGSNTTENNTNSIEYSIPFFEQLTQQWTATSWNLTKIISAEGRSINFTYEPDDYISNMYIYFLWDVTVYLNGNNRVVVGNYGNQYGFGQNEWTADWINPRYASYLGNLIRPTYLRRIDGANIAVEFTRSNSEELRYGYNIYKENKKIQKIVAGQIPGLYGTGYCWNFGPEIFWDYLHDIIQSTDDETILTALKWKKLDTIKILDKGNSNSGWQYTLNYDNTASERLRLGFISKKALDNSISILNYYNFDYYDDPNIIMPNYLEECTDHWGYYNGNTQKCFTQLRTWNFTQNGPSDISLCYTLREPTNNLNVAIEGSLKSITYPTRGKTTFEYEQNSYSKIFDLVNCDGTTPNCVQNVTGNPKSGGLRINRIINEPVLGSTTIKEYYYVSGYTPTSAIESLPSSGILSGKNQYFWSNYNPKVNSSEVKKIEKIIISGQSVLPMSINSQGVPVGYSEVVEKREDGSFTIYKYSNYQSEDGIHFDEKPLPGSYNDLSPYSVYSSKAIERGRLISTEFFKNDGTKVKQENNIYTCLSTDYVRSLYLTANTYVCYDSELWTAYLGLPYKKYIYKYKITKDIVAENHNSSGQNPIIITNDYKYNSNNLLSLQSTIQSDGSVLTTEYKYPNDYLAPYSENTSIKQLVGRNILNAEIEKISSITRGTDKYIVGAQFTKYGLFNNNIKPQTVYSLNSAAPVLYSNYNGWNLSSSSASSLVLHTTNTSDISPQSISLELNTNNCIVFNPSTIGYSSSDGSSSMTLQIDNLYSYQATNGTNASVPQFSLTNPKGYIFTLTYNSSTNSSYGGSWNASYTVYSSNSNISVNSALKPEITFDYDDYGNIIDVQKTNNINTSYLWSYNQTHPVVKGDNVTYDILNAAVNTAVIAAGATNLETFWSGFNDIATNDTQQTDWRSFNTSLRSNATLANAQITTYTYKPLVGLTSQTDPNGKTTYYEYDTFGRLQFIKDDQGKIVKKYDYHYSTSN
jgi:YD repeat-containing protein